MLFALYVKPAGTSCQRSAVGAGGGVCADVNSSSQVTSQVSRFQSSA